MNLPDQTALDFEALFEAVPGLYVVVRPGEDYPVVAVSTAFLRATMGRREDFLGRSLFAVFAGDGQEPGSADGTSLRAALERVRRGGGPEQVSNRPRNAGRPEPDGQGAEQRHW